MVTLRVLKRLKGLGTVWPFWRTMCGILLWLNLAVSYRILWAKFKFPRGKMRVVVVCGFTEGDVEERDRFWNYLYRVVHIEGNGYRLCVRRSEWMGWR